MSTTEDKNIFHYTGTAGLRGILGKRELWATDSNFLNDTSEGKIPDEILRRLSKMTNAYGLHFDLANKWLEEKAKGISESRFFVSCFCRHADLLSQWRGYSSGLTGYALGFNREVLANQIDNKGLRIEDCIYIKDSGYHQVEDAFGNKLDEVKLTFLEHEPPEKEGVISEQMRWMEGPTAEQKAACEPLLDEFWNSTIERIIGKRPFLKPDAFREESETRIVIPAEAGKKIEYRDNSNNLIPYLPIDISKVIENGGLSCIFVGPSPNHGRAIRGLERFLEDEGITEVDIFSTAATFTRH
jgi:hypothetical protein